MSDQQFVDELSNDCIEVHVEGKTYLISRHDILKYPDSKLAKHIMENEKTEIRFNRDSVCFNAIRNFYATGKLHMPASVCPNAFKEELNFWGIEEKQLDLCCSLKYQAHQDDLRHVQKFKHSLYQSSNKVTPSLKVRVWDVLENQSASAISKIYNAVATVIVITSVVLIAIRMQSHGEKNALAENKTRPAKIEILEPCLETDPEVDEFLEYVCFQIGKCSSLMEPFLIPTCNYSCPELEREASMKEKIISKICWKCELIGMIDIFMEKSVDEAKIASVKKAEALLSFVNHSLEIKDVINFESIFLVLYTGEFISRIWSCPSKITFIGSVLNWIDILTITSSWVHFIIQLTGKEMSAMFIQVILVVELLRVFRLIRSTKHLDAFRVLTYAVSDGIKDLLVIILYLIIGTIIFGSLIFTVEPHEGYPTIGEAMWWSIITMTTVGYGDVYPVTAIGKVIACFCALYGLIMLALTIPVFTSTFQTVYRYTSCRNNHS